MKKATITVTVLVILTFLSLWIRADTGTHHTSFREFIAGVKKEAIQQGVSVNTANKYLDSLKPPKSTPSNPTPTMHDERHQAEVVLTFHEYLNQLTPPDKIKQAKQEYLKHKTLLLEISDHYHVPPGVIIALWGIESNFGQDMGHFDLVHTLAILAYHHSHDKYFRKQLIDSLKVLDQPHVFPLMELSAFDGGMGQTQFEPGTYLYYAVDYDHNGFPNIWTSLPDVFASIANFLHTNGWDGSQSWGMEVKLPKNFPMKYVSDDTLKPVQFWKKLGVTQLDGSSLPNIKDVTGIVLPDHKLSPAYLTYHNFQVLLTWNNTNFEALAVGYLAHQSVPYPLR